MLNLAYLMEEAKELGLPQPKKRAILREYLQTIILNSIYKSNFAKSMFFVGGTALRFFYTLPRFSEDLDRGVLYANNIREEPKKNSWPCISKKKPKSL